MTEQSLVELEKKKEVVCHENWNQFFSRLAHAENAAAEQCNVISKLFSDRSQNALAEKYRSFASEEKNHFRLVSQICKPLLDPPTSVERVYSGELMNRTKNPIERMATIHLVFEPAALAFLGFFHQKAEQLIDDHEWADDIKQSFREILQDEVTHVYSGAAVIKQLLKQSSESDIAITKRSMKRHRAFIIAGVKEMFKSDPKSKAFIRPMISRFNTYYARATEGVFA